MTQNRTSTGQIVLVAYEPTLTSGKLYVWHPSDNCTDVLRMLVEVPLADVDVTTDTPNFPVEWSDALIYGLADRLEPNYRMLSAGRRQELKQNALMYLQEAKAFDNDEGPLYFQPG